MPSVDMRTSFLTQSRASLLVIVLLVVAISSKGFIQLLVSVPDVSASMPTMLLNKQSAPLLPVSPPPPLPSPPPPPPPRQVALAPNPLPNCSVVFFHHLEKSAGTTLRSVLQRQSQLGHFDSIVYIGRLNKQLNQLVLHRLSSLLRTPGGLVNLRLLVEMYAPLASHNSCSFRKASTACI